MYWLCVCATDTVLVLREISVHYDMRTIEVTSHSDPSRWAGKSRHWLKERGEALVRYKWGDRTRVGARGVDDVQIWASSERCCLRLSGCPAGACLPCLGVRTDGLTSFFTSRWRHWMRCRDLPQQALSGICFSDADSRDSISCRCDIYSTQSLRSVRGLSTYSQWNNQNRLSLRIKCVKFVYFSRLVILFLHVNTYGNTLKRF